MSKKTRRPSMARRLVSHISELLLIALTLCAGFLMAEFSCEPSLAHISEMETRYIILNFTTLSCLWGAMIILTCRVWLGCLLAGAVTGFIALVNYYVLLFHGLPLSGSTIRNFSTAMNVISAYDLTPDRNACIIIAAIIAVVALCLLARKLVCRRRVLTFGTLLRDMVIVISCAGFIWFSYFGQNPMKPSSDTAWLWSASYYKYGYAPCTFVSFRDGQGANAPDGYSAKAVEEIAVEKPAETETQTPDVILILNETFYDLGMLTDLNADAPYISEIYELDGAVTGGAIVPRVGGGTNNSEYELLSSNSLQLMPMITPFNSLDMNGANSIVSHLKSLGYYTVAAHPSKSINYMRGLAYPAMGFDKSYFLSDFTENAYYGKRWYETDSSVYGNLIRWYEAAPEDQPRFMYMLTIQNHAGYDMNAAEYDTVHALNDFGELDSQIDEYLSCLSLSDQAFVELTEYFAQVDRPVIVCMVGDHSPAMIYTLMDCGYINADGKYDNVQQNLKLRETPLVMWANFELDLSGDDGSELGVISLNQVAPTLLKLAGIESTPYYDYMLKLQKDVPILTAYGCYIDAAGNYYEYANDDNSPYADAVDTYLNMEYNNLQKNRRQELFAPYAN